MWNQLLVWLGLRPPPATAQRENTDSLIQRYADFGEFLKSLGYHPEHEAEADRLMAGLKSSIRAEITDYDSFQSALTAAAIRSRNMQSAGRFELLDSLTAARDETGALALLNADPIHDQVPFIEQIPVPRNGGMAWRSPVDHSLIRRLPVDPASFRKTLEELGRLFSEPHAARSEPLRLEVLDAIARLRKELDRDKSYLPTPLQFLETKLAGYKTNSLKPGADRLLQTLLSITGILVELRNRVEVDGEADAASRIPEQAARYLAAPQIQAPWLTNYLLSLLLHPSVTRPRAGMLGILRFRESKTMTLIGAELASGYYDAEETARRLRRMEPPGLRVNSLVYPLLRLRAQGRDKGARHHT